MKIWTRLGHGGALALLLSLFGGTLLSLSIDLASHFSLVDEIMKYGRIRPAAENLGVYMAIYPPLSHWMAAVLGWIIGSGLVSLWLVAITCVYVSYYVIGRLAATATPFIALPVFAVIFSLLARSRAQLGWEVIVNFFYPQLVGFTVYLFLILWLSRQPPNQVWPALVAAILSPIVYLIQPIIGVHLTAAIVGFLFIEGVCIWFAERRFSKLHAAAIATTIVFGAATVKHPSVAVMLGISSNDGFLTFGFPGDMLLLPCVLCVAASLANLLSGMRRWPIGHIDRLVGAAGAAAGGLMLLQYLMLLTLNAGSFYAVKKHVFIVVTLGGLNLARLVAQQFRVRSLPAHWQPLAAIGFALFTTVVVFNRGGGWKLEPIIAIQRYAELYVETSATFHPGNTAAFAASVPATINYLVSISALKNPQDRASRAFGVVDREASYLLVDQPPGGLSCALLGNSSFAIVPRACWTTTPIATRIEFRYGGNGLRFLGAGWQSPEVWGVWGGPRSTMVLGLPKRQYKLTARVSAFLSPSYPQREFNINVSGRTVATWAFSIGGSETGDRTANIPVDAIPDNGLTEIEIVPTTPLISPAEAGISADPRELGMGLISMVIE